MKPFSAAADDPRAARRPTMHDVARLAGVSLATVSRVVNASGEVRPELAARVQDAVVALGYRRDLMASNLRRTNRVTATIGLIIEDVANPFSSAVHRGVEDVARSHGVLTFAGSSDEDPERERELAGAFASRGVDGLVIVPCGVDQGYLQRERRLGMQLVFVDRPGRLIDADAVVCDNAAGAEAGVAHLVRAGHRRIALLADRQSVSTASERRAGYVAALEAAGIAEDPALRRVGLTTSDAAAAATRELLLAPDPPTALFSAQNLITVGAMRALRDQGRQHDIALVGFDDVALGGVVDPGTTVIAQDPHALGRRAAELLFRRLHGHAGKSELIVLPTELIRRGSGEIATSASQTPPGCR